MIRHKRNPLKSIERKKYTPTAQPPSRSLAPKSQLNDMGHMQVEFYPKMRMRNISAPHTHDPCLTFWSDRLGLRLRSSPLLSSPDSLPAWRSGLDAGDAGSRRFFLCLWVRERDLRESKGKCYILWWKWSTNNINVRETLDMTRSKWNYIIICFNGTVL